jgi:hypothetical protein
MNTVHATGASYVNGESYANEISGNRDVILALLVVMVLFVMAGILLGSSMFVPADYQIFW